AQWPDQLDDVASLQVAKIVGTNALSWIAVVIRRYPLDGQRQIVITRTLAITRTGDGILPGMIRLAVVIEPWRENRNRLTFQDRKRLIAEIQDDMANIAFRIGGRYPVVADDRRRNGILVRIQVDIRMRGGPRRDGRSRTSGCHTFKAGDFRGGVS